MHREFDPPYIVAGKLLMFFLVFVSVGWNEELLSRGYHLQTIASGLNLFWGVVLSSALFGLLHLGNPHATWVSTAGIFLGGAFLAYGFMRTKQLLLLSVSKWKHDELQYPLPKSVLKPEKAALDAVSKNLPLPTECLVAYQACMRY